MSEHRSSQKLRWPCCDCVGRSGFLSSTPGVGFKGKLLLSKRKKQLKKQKGQRGPCHVDRWVKA